MKYFFFFFFFFYVNKSKYSFSKLANFACSRLFLLLVTIAESILQLIEYEEGCAYYPLL